MNEESYKLRIQLLEDENDLLRERLRIFQQAENDNHSVAVLMGLTRMQNRIISPILSKSVASYEQIMLSCYADKPDEAPDRNTVKVQVHRMKIKLKKFGVELKTKFGVGYFMSKEDKEKIRQLCADFGSVNGLKISTASENSASPYDASELQGTWR